MEGVECHLGRGLTDGLTSDDTDSLTRLNQGTEVLEIKHLLEALLENLTLRILLLILEQFVLVVVDVL
jgi:hypothetical protein